MPVLELKHDNGDSKIVEVVNGHFTQGWKKGRKLLVVKWGDFAGTYALDIVSNNLYGFGLGNGVRRKALGWHAVDIDLAKQLWNDLTSTGRSISERFNRKNF